MAEPIQLPPTCLWFSRLTRERNAKNISEAHHRVGLHLFARLEDGEDTDTHATIAEAVNLSPTTVRDALKRLRYVGLIDWEARYEHCQGRPRRLANRYRWTLPPEDQPVTPRPEIRRHRRDSGVLRARESIFKPESVSKNAHEKAVEALARVRLGRQSGLLALWQSRRSHLGQLYPPQLHRSGP